MTTQLSQSGQARPIEILLVEDDLVDYKLTKRAFDNNRILNNLHLVRDGVEALAFLRQEGDFAGKPRPDFILLDLNMPRKDGRETLHEIKKDPKLKTIPVVILTTSSDQNDIATSYSEHANCYITKPVDMEQFTKAILETSTYWFSVVTLPVK